MYRPFWVSYLIEHADFSCPELADFQPPVQFCKYVYFNNFFIDFVYIYYINKLLFLVSVFLFFLPICLFLTTQYSLRTTSIVDSDPDRIPIFFGCWIRIRIGIRVKSWIRIRVRLKIEIQHL
jgi:hypothetical protein